MTRVLVCGSRDWDDEVKLWRTLDRLLRQHGELVVVEGEARGADQMAAEWALTHGQQVLSYPADWRRYGRGAGPRRNQQMLDEAQPELVVAFHPDLPASKGTADMVRRARRAGLPVEVVS